MACDANGYESASHGYRHNFAGCSIRHFAQTGAANNENQERRISNDQDGDSGSPRNKPERRNEQQEQIQRWRKQHNRITATNTACSIAKSRHHCKYYGDTCPRNGPQQAKSSKVHNRGF